MNSLSTPEHALKRQWRASLNLEIADRGDKSVLLSSMHEGPLRVQRPFFPECNGCCHLYILHPPGGLVIGDELTLGVDVREKAKALLTTPSAGKVYGAKNRRDAQKQNIRFRIERGACLEWLPQETIIFNTAQAQLTTRIELEGDGKIFAWDIARLGRIASGEHFTAGRCLQTIELWRDDRPLFMEKNRIVAGEDLQNAVWGLQAQNTTGTLVASMQLTRDAIDQLYEKLKGYEGLWGLTQKQDVFIARYLGDNISSCRAGFEFLWQATRTHFNGSEAMRPRIWNT